AACATVRAAPRIEFRRQKELCESRVSLIGLTVIQTYLRIARQFKFAGTAAVIDQRHRAYLGICIRHDTNNTPGLDIAIPSTKLGAIGVKLVCAFISGLRQRLSANRPQAFVAEVANVIELPPTVARGVFPPAVYTEAAPAAVASPGGRDHHAVRAVGEQRYRRLRFHFLSFRHRTSKLRPVISTGCGSPRRKSKVGATSARMPSSTRNSAASAGTPMKWKRVGGGGGVGGALWV